MFLKVQRDPEDHLDQSSLDYQGVLGIQGTRVYLMSLLHRHCQLVRDFPEVRSLLQFLAVPPVPTVL